MAALGTMAIITIVVIAVICLLVAAVFILPQFTVSLSAPLLPCLEAFFSLFANRAPYSLPPMARVLHITTLLPILQIRPVPAHSPG